MGKAGDVAMGTSKEGFNCAQAVLSAFAEQHGLTREQGLRVSAGFGGGMGRMGLTCGAVTGAFMALGLAAGATRGDDIKAKQRTYELARAFVAKFRERHPSLACRDLIGMDISTQEGHDEAVRMGVLKKVCPGVIRDACDIVEELTGRS
jgi:C_GCAxxG_C_C family probable redox protein